MTDQIVIVDGYSFVFRAYHAVPPLTRPEDGVPVGAVYGFTSMLMKLMLDMQPKHFVVVFDAGKKTYRNEIYPEYKSHRPPTPEDLIPQFALVREAAAAFNIKILEKEGFEADDIIATLARMAKAQSEKVLIVSSDKDLMQLIDDNVKMYDAIRTRVIGKDEVKEKYGVWPEQMRDFLALVGDAADNVPGLPGIGVKTAAELLGIYGSIDGILAHVNEIKQAKRREVIQNNKPLLDLSRRLISLTDDVSIGATLEDLKAKAIDSQTVLAFLSKQGFRSLIARVRNEFNVRETEAYAPEQTQERKEQFIKTSSYKTITHADELKQINSAAERSGKIAIYLQNSFVNHLELKSLSDVHSIGISCDENSVYCVHIGSSHVDFKDFIEQLALLLSNTAIKKIFYDYKLLLHIIKSPYITDYARGVDDLMVMSYALGGGRGLNSYEELLEFYLNDQSVRPPADGGITKARDWFAGLDNNAEHIAGKARLMLRLHGVLTDLLFQNHKQALYQKFDRPLSDIVYNMEFTGIKLEKSLIQSLSAELDKEIEKTSIEIYKLAGSKFNIASPKQVGEVLFVFMSLPGSTKSKTGEYSTDIETLERLQADGHTIADFLIKWRQLNKLKTSYTDSLVDQVDPETGRIHTNFSIAYTATGRFGSTNPNLQNIPIKGEYGNVIRSAFIADDGWKIFSADYSQVELRILAHIANVRLLKNVFQDGSIDIHSVTASELFEVPLNQVTAEMRRKAKAINFGIAYGMREHGLAKNLGVSRIEASRYLSVYFAKYPEVLSYMDSIKKFAAQHGYVETIAGRRCYVPDINSKNGNARVFAERAAINAPIQGTNADIVRRAMVMLHDTVLSESRNIRMLLQVHDELLFEIKDDAELEGTVAQVRKVMESSHLLPDVPLKVNCTVSSSWSGT